MKWIVFVLIMLTVPFCFAEDFGYNSLDNSFGTFQKGNAITLRQMCANCSFNNITSVVYPNGSSAVTKVVMVGDGAEYTYSLNSDYTQQIGTYYVNGFGDLLGVDTSWVYTFEITENGKPNPDGITNVFYVLLFFIVFSLMIVTLFNNLGSLAEVSFDLKDLTYSYIAFFGYLTYYYFVNIYFDMPFIMDILDAMLWVAGFTHLFIPGVALIFSIIKTKGFTK